MSEDAIVIGSYLLLFGRTNDGKGRGRISYQSMHGIYGSLIENRNTKVDE